MPSQPIDVLSPPENVQVILLPVRNEVFSERAERLKTLARDHSLADWLLFLSHLTRAQYDTLQTLGELSLPEAGLLEQARLHGMPPLNATALQRPKIWHEVLKSLIDSLIPHAPKPASARLQALRSTSAERLEKMADGLFEGTPEPEDLGDLPFIAAALQVIWTAWASCLDASTLAPFNTPEVCPCCGSLPVVSVVRSSSAVNNLRYLHCSLCNSEWNIPRTTCTSCSTDKNVSYRQIEGSNGAVRAECCDSCKSYLKILVQEKNPAVDPVADDLATLALDMLVDEAGYSRSGPNLLLLGGAA